MKTTIYNIKFVSSFIIFFLSFCGIFLFYKILEDIEFYKFLNLLTYRYKEILLSMFFTLLGYFSLVGYDWSALKYINKKLNFGKVVFTSFVSYSFSNTVGVSLLSGGAIRYRLYKNVGLSIKEIIAVTTFCIVGFGIGETIVGWMVLIIYPEVFANYFSISSSFVRIVSIVIFTVLMMGLMYVSYEEKLLKFRQFKFKVPSLDILLGQILFSLFDIFFSGVALYILFPDSQLPFVTFLLIYTIALVISHLTYIPGGIGAFEVVIIFLLKDYILIDILLMTLVLYRIIYSFIPFLLGIILLYFSEFKKDN